jgi:hypothetical protein
LPKCLEIPFNAIFRILSQKYQVKVRRISGLSQRFISEISDRNRRFFLFGTSSMKDLPKMLNGLATDAGDQLLWVRL